MIVILKSCCATYDNNVLNLTTFDSSKLGLILLKLTLKYRFIDNIMLLVLTPKYLTAIMYPLLDVTLSITLF